MKGRQRLKKQWHTIEIAKRTTIIIDMKDVFSEENIEQRWLIPNISEGKEK